MELQLSLSHQGLNSHLRIQAQGFETRWQRSSPSLSLPDTPSTSVPHLSSTVYRGSHSHRPVEDSRAVGTHGRVAVEGEQHVALPAELAHKALGLAPLQARRGGQCPLPGWGAHPPKPPSHLPALLATPLACHRAPALAPLGHSANARWLAVLQTALCICHRYSLRSDQDLFSYSPVDEKLNIF